MVKIKEWIDKHAMLILIICTIDAFAKGNKC